MHMVQREIDVARDRSLHGRNLQGLQSLSQWVNGKAGKALPHLHRSQKTHGGFSALGTCTGWNMVWGILTWRFDHSMESDSREKFDWLETSLFSWVLIVFPIPSFSAATGQNRASLLAQWSYLINGFETSYGFVYCCIQRQHCQPCSSPFEIFIYSNKFGVPQFFWKPLKGFSQQYSSLCWKLVKWFSQLSWRV